MCKSFSRGVLENKVQRLFYLGSLLFLVLEYVHNQQIFVITADITHNKEKRVHKISKMILL